MFDTAKQQSPAASLVDYADGKRFFVLEDHRPFGYMIRAYDADTGRFIACAYYNLTDGYEGRIARKWKDYTGEVLSLEAKC